MMNFSHMSKKEARVQYLDGNFKIIEPGSFVLCAVTKKIIALEDLQYWSVARQEAYCNAETSFMREMEFHFLS